MYKYIAVAAIFSACSSSSPPKKPHADGGTKPPTVSSPVVNGNDCNENPSQTTLPTENNDQGVANAQLLDGSVLDSSNGDAVSTHAHDMKKHKDAGIDSDSDSSDDSED